MLTSSEIKKALRAAGLEVYRSRGDQVHLAERVRENLILDAGIRIGGHPLHVTFVTETQRGRFPNDDEDTLFERSRGLAGPALERGFRERGTHVADDEDPSNPDQVLDQRFQVSFAKEVADLDAAIEEARFLLGMTRQTT